MATIAEFEAAKADVVRLEDDLAEARTRVRVMSIDEELANELAIGAARHDGSVRLID